MDSNLDLDAYCGFDFDSFDPNRQPFLNLQSQSWPLPLQPAMSHNNNNNNAAADANQQQQQQQRRYNTIASTTAANNSTSLVTTSCAVAPLQTSGLGFSSAMQTASNAMLTDWVQLSGAHFNQQAVNYNQSIAGLNTPDFAASFGGLLQTSPTEDFNINTTQAQNYMTMTSSMEAPLSFMTSAGMDMMPAPFQMTDFSNELANFSNQPDYSAPVNSASVGSGSPTESWLEIRSLSSSDNDWTAVTVGHRNSLDMTNANDPTLFIHNPSEALHIRTHSESSQISEPLSAHSFESFQENRPFQNMHSPSSDTGLELVQSHHSHSSSCMHGLPHEADFAYISPSHSVSPPVIPAEPVDIKQPVSNSTSPTSSAVSSPSSRRRKSPVGAKVAKTIQKKPAHSTKKDQVGEKRVGRRRGPLRPDQRQQAHEIRKLRACLRCKFLKKTCDKGDPCGGCQPSHARLWQVPCTRIDIKDIAYFMKDWKADYERHVSLGFSVGNIKGFSPQERPIYITHGYGHFLPIMAREVYVRDEKCFGVDWVETLQGLHFETNTAKLSAGMEGISHSMLSDYLDRHIDGGFEQFVDEYFEGTYFLTELLKTAYRFYCREKLPVIRKALKLVVAYNLTLHVTMVEGLPDDEANVGKVDDKASKFCGKTVAPVMINFQVKCALADMWRELQKDVLEELSSLYSSVYSGEKLKNWPTIFMLAAILLAVWELIQFDCHYRVPDTAAVNKFCNDMESTPVGVIVGLFSAISQKLPAFTEWDTRKHHHLLNSNPAVCDAMTEVRAHVTKYESYLRSRSECKFDRQDFDSLSNKFLSKLVIRAN